jgi:hypothetical protein
VIPHAGRHHLSIRNQQRLAKLKTEGKERQKQMKNTSDPKYSAPGVGNLNDEERAQMARDLRQLELDGTIEYVDGMWRLASPNNAD